MTNRESLTFAVAFSVGSLFSLGLDITAAVPSALQVGLLGMSLAVIWTYILANETGLD